MLPAIPDGCRITVRYTGDVIYYAVADVTHVVDPDGIAFLLRLNLLAVVVVENRVVEDIVGGIARGHCFD